MTDKDFLAAVGITPWELDPATGRHVSQPEASHPVVLIELGVRRLKLHFESAFYLFACAAILGATFCMNR
jgi:hypothetical protein